MYYEFILTYLMLNVRKNTYKSKQNMLVILKINLAFSLTKF